MAEITCMMTGTKPGGSPLTIEPNFIYITCSESQARQLDAQWVKSKKMYKLPNTLGALRELHKQGFNVTEYGKKKAAQRDQVLYPKTFSDVPLDFKRKFGWNLRPYQRTDIFFLQQLPHAAVFNEQRTGEQV